MLFFSKMDNTKKYNLKESKSKEYIIKASLFTLFLYILSWICLGIIILIYAIITGDTGAIGVL